MAPRHVFTFHAFYMQITCQYGNRKIEFKMVDDKDGSASLWVKKPVFSEKTGFYFAPSACFRK
jgi:hypothetical protein